MTWFAAGDGAWAARVTGAGIPLELFDARVDDDDFTLLAAAIRGAARERTLSDDDLYPLLVAFWNGHPPRVDWPPHAAVLARRCATALAAREPCQLGVSSLPTKRSVRVARDTVVAELQLTKADLLAAVTERWEHISSREMPEDGRCTLLAFAEHILLTPVASACVLLWSAQHSPCTATDPAEPNECPEWSPVPGDDWIDIIVTELACLGRPLDDALEDGDRATGLLASARAAVLDGPDGPALVAASIVRTSGWPGQRDLVTRLANRAVGYALDRAGDINTDDDDDDVVDAVRKQLMPGAHDLLGWARDPSFATLADPLGRARTGTEMLDDAARWLTWSVSHAAVHAVRAMRRHSPANA